MHKYQIRMFAHRALVDLLLGLLLVLDPEQASSGQEFLTMEKPSEVEEHFSLGCSLKISKHFCTLFRLN